MRSAVPFVIAACAVVAFPCAAAAQDAAQAPPVSAPPADATVMRLVKLLVGNGIISQQQADTLLVEAQKGDVPPPAQIAAAQPPRLTGPDTTAAQPSAGIPAPPTGTAAAQERDRSEQLADVLGAPGYRGATDRGNRHVEPGVAGKSTADPSQQTIEAPVDAARARMAQARKSPSASGLKVAWNRGSPLFSTSDGYLTFRVRGQLGMDIQSTTGSSNPVRNITTTGAREMRIGIEGTVGSHFFYMLEPDFLENRIAVQGAFVGYRGKLLGRDFDVRAGNVTLDRGLEYTTGVETQEFTDRSTASFATLPQINFFGLGLYARYFGKTWHVSASIVGDQLDNAKAASDSRVVDARFHWNPVKTRNGLIHLGFWGMDEALSDAARQVERNTTIGGRFNDNLRVSTGDLPDGKGRPPTDWKCWASTATRRSGRSTATGGSSSSPARRSRTSTRPGGRCPAACSSPARRRLIRRGPARSRSRSSSARSSTEAPAPLNSSAGTRNWTIPTPRRAAPAPR